MNFVVISSLALILLVCAQVESTAMDIGTCGCLCGNNENEGSAVAVGRSDSNFYQRMRGPRGQSGLVGKRGKQGPKGLQGSPGEPGLSGLHGEKGENSADLGTRMKPAESCSHLRQIRNSGSGIYTIQPTTRSSPYEVYCDMESAGGGWTLVASVHENDIKGKCTIGDKWSSEQGDTDENYRGSGNWENYNTFGRLEGATNDDFKSLAYFNLQATDVMIWHVPNDVDISKAYSEATLKYYTDTGFLTEYGGTLQSLYSKHFPLIMTNESKNSVANTTSLAIQFNRSSAAIRATVPNFHMYTFDYSGVSQNFIIDGGSDMFNVGNKVFYQIGNGPETSVTYNKRYRHPKENVDVLATTSHPFATFMWVGNPGGAVSTFSLKVISRSGTGGGGRYTSFSGSASKGNFVLTYYAFLVYSSSSDPSIAKVFYYVKNEEEWGSVPPGTFSQTPWSSGTDQLQHGVRVYGSPRSILVGYMLLSRVSASYIDNSYIRNALIRTLNVIEESSELGCHRLDETLVQPIIYLKGNNDQVMDGIPPIANSTTVPGYLQFRAFTRVGVPNALCPAVKTEYCRPHFICIGGINSFQTEEKSCGDFAGWSGMDSDSPTSDTPDGAARPTNDLKKTILIFTRNQN